MGEFSVLLCEIKKDKDNFEKLISKMNPLINKYVKLLYKDESEDIRAELYMALWEAIIKLEYIENDARCIVYLCNALRNKFLELYRKSKKQHENCVIVEFNELIDRVVDEEKFADINIRRDLESFWSNYSEQKRNICKDIFLENKSDADIAQKYNMSRQYVNRIRRVVCQEIKEKYYER